MIEIELRPALSALTETCETICEVECCGLDALNFSPFSIIYHLTKWRADVRDEQVQELRAELVALDRDYGRSGERGQGACITEWNAILSGEQISSLTAEIDAALSKACTIYAGERDAVDAAYVRYLEICK